MNRFFSGSEITRLDKLNRPNKKFMFIATMASKKGGKIGWAADRLIVNAGVVLGALDGVGMPPVIGAAPD